MKYALLIIGIFFATSAQSQWMRTSGPGNVVSFAAMGDTLFAGAKEGLYISTDTGANWKEIAFDSDWVAALAVNQGTLFAGTLKHGLFASTDAGVTWVPDTNGLPDSVAIDALVVTYGSIVAGTTVGIFCTTSNGAQWEPTSVKGVAEPLATNGDGVCAIVGDTAFYFSSDQGVHWLGLASWFGYSYSMVLFHDTIIAAANSGEGVLMSTNLGMTWVSIDSGLPIKPSFNVHAILLDSGYVILGTNYGVFLLRPGSAVWRDVTNNAHDRFGNPMFVHSMFLRNGTVWSGSDDNVWFRPFDDILAQSSVAITARGSTSIAIYPNPVHDRVTIDLSTFSGEPVHVRVVNELGEEVATLINGMLQTNSLVWNALGTVPGVCDCLVETREGNFEQPMVIVR